MIMMIMAEVMTLGAISRLALLCTSSCRVIIPRFMTFFLGGSVLCFFYERGLLLLTSSMIMVRYLNQSA
jgi:uncharacterized membrane protein